MSTEKFRWLASLIAAHPNRELIGRTRLQKEVWFLQRLGMPTDYEFRIHHFGPYSDGVQADISVLTAFGLVQEDVKANSDGNCYSVFRASMGANGLPSMTDFERAITTLNKADATILELAATFDAYRTFGLTDEAATNATRVKKGAKCDGDNLDRARSLVSSLALPAPREAVR